MDDLSPTKLNLITIWTCLICWFNSVLLWDYSLHKGLEGKKHNVKKTVESMVFWFFFFGLFHKHRRSPSPFSHVQIHIYPSPIRSKNHLFRQIPKPIQILALCYDNLYAYIISWGGRLLYSYCSHCWDQVPSWFKMDYRSGSKRLKQGIGEMTRWLRALPAFFRGFGFSSLYPPLVAHKYLEHKFQRLCSGFLRLCTYTKTGRHTYR